MAARIRKGDLVYITSGKYKGRTGHVTEMMPKKGECIVEKVNVVKRHQKAKAAGQPAGIIEKALPICLSKVMLFDEGAKKPSRVKFAIEAGKKVRTYAKSGKKVAA